MQALTRSGAGLTAPARPADDGLGAVPGAILRPSRPDERRGIAQVYGVFSAEGRPVERAGHLSHSGDLMVPAPCPDAAGLPLRPGRWLFGGIGMHHFGHALIFSTARLWALDHLESPPEGILFLERAGTSAAPPRPTRPGTTRHLQAVLAFLGVDLPVWTVARDERIEELVVPPPGISTDERLFSGTPDHRRFVRRRIEAIPASGAHERVYVSRSRLGAHKGGLLFEDRLEAALAEEGYHIFHPQDHPLEAQIALYRGARRIIGVDGSAMHLVAFAADPRARVAILARRDHFAPALAAQVAAFSGASAVALTSFTRAYAPASALDAGLEWYQALCPTDFPRLGADLAAAGFLDHRPDWKNPSGTRLQRRLDRIAARLGQPMVPIDL